jgi:divalent metal cation (Fe/Co/Zn/Cd) transporter
VRRFAVPIPEKDPLDGRTALIKRAVRLQWFTIVWMVLEGTVALWSGVAAHSLSLIAFGADSLIELISAGLVLWRLKVEANRGKEFSESAERSARKVAGILLFALAAYVLVSAVWSLLDRQGAEFSLPGLLLTIFTIPLMYLLFRHKSDLARSLASAALRADAVETLTCAYLSAVVVVGLVCQLLMNAWWIDGATSLLIIYFVIKEGFEALSADED